MLMRNISSEPFKCRPNCRHNINEIDNQGVTALVHSISNDDEANVQMLLEKGADVNLPRKHHTATFLIKPPLFAAVEKQNISIIKMLLNHGADINIEDTCKCTTRMSAVLNGLNIGGQSCENGVDLLNLEVIKLLLQYGADVNHVDYFGSTALMCASKRNDVEIVSLLLEYGCDINTVDKGNETALTKAVTKGNEAIIRLLLANGASTEIGYEEKPLLVTAIEYNKFSSFCCLIELGADMNVIYQGDSMLTYLLKPRNFREKFVIHLLDLGAKLSSSESMLAVHESVVYGEIDLLSCLLQNGSFCPLIINEHCQGAEDFYELEEYFGDNICSPLFIALISGQHKIARMLLEFNFLTHSDLYKLQRHRRLQIEMQERKLTKSLEILNELPSVPSLVQLSFVKISKLIGCEPGRREKVEQLELPPKLKRHLTYRSFPRVNTSSNDEVFMGRPFDLPTRFERTNSYSSEEQWLDKVGQVSWIIWP